jgi:transcriptional regulator with XRE-family HTH domain
VLYFSHKGGGKDMAQFDRVDTTAHRLSQAMKEAHKTQADIVRETGIDKGALSHYLKGNYEPKQDVVYKLAVALNVSEMWLWGYDCVKDRPVDQKNDDILADIVIEAQRNPDFFQAIEALYNMDAQKRAAFLSLIK